MTFNHNDRIEHKDSAFEHTVRESFSSTSVSEVRDAAIAMGSSQVPQNFGNLEIDHGVAPGIKLAANENSSSSLSGANSGEQRIQVTVPQGYNAVLSGDCPSVATRPNPDGGTDVSIGRKPGEAACTISISKW